MSSDDKKIANIPILIKEKDAKEFIEADDGSEYAQTSYVKLILPMKYLIQLKIVMARDKISKYKLIKELINGYIENDPDIRSFINKRFGHKYTSAENKAREKEAKYSFYREKDLSDVEVDSIYDELEGEDL